MKTSALVASYGRRRRRDRSHHALSFRVSSRTTEQLRQSSSGRPVLSSRDRNTLFLDRRPSEKGRSEGKVSTVRPNGCLAQLVTRSTVLNQNPISPRLPCGKTGDGDGSAGNLGTESRGTQLLLRDLEAVAATVEGIMYCP